MQRASCPPLTAKTTTESLRVKRLDQVLVQQGEQPDDVDLALRWIAKHLNRRFELRKMQQYHNGYWLATDPETFAQSVLATLKQVKSESKGVCITNHLLRSVDPC